MVYNTTINVFMKEDPTDNDIKVEKVKDLSTGDLLALVRNIEECPREYEKDIQSAVAKCLLDKNIYIF